MSRDAIRDHLEYFRELGVDGIRLEPEWRTRVDVRERGTDSATPVDSNDDSERARRTAIPLIQSDALAAVKLDIGPDCSRCKLHTLGRRQVVFGVGNPNADLMFVGEAPDRKSVV